MSVVTTAGNTPWKDSQRRRGRAERRGGDSDAATAPHGVMTETAGFSARYNTPFVTGELLNPVSATSSAAANPVSRIKARKSFPGMAPPRHPAQVSTMDPASGLDSAVRT